MAEGAFGLQGLLNLRHLQEEQAKRDLATANVNLNQADQRLKAAHDRLSNMTATSGSNLAVATAMRNATRMQIQEGIARKEYAEAMVEQRQQEWKGTKRLVATLEKLENRYNEATLADDLHKEQIILGEITSRRGSAPNTMGGAKAKLYHEEIETVRRHQ